MYLAPRFGSLHQLPNSEWRTTKGSWILAAQLIQLRSKHHEISTAYSANQTDMVDLQSDEIHFLASVVHEGLQKDPRAVEDGEMSAVAYLHKLLSVPPDRLISTYVY